MSLKNVFDKEHPDKVLDSLNDLNLEYMYAYIKHHLEAGNITVEEVEKYYAQTSDKSPKDKKRFFALAFMPDLLKPNAQSFTEKLKVLIEANKKEAK